MDIQARKLILIEEFIRITDESIIDKLESIIKREKKSQKEKEFKPMSLESFHDMIDRSVSDYENGRAISHEDLKKRV